MSSLVKKPWFNVAFTEIVICCFPLAIFTFMSMENRDFAQMFSSFVLLIMLFVGYILFKNYKFRDKTQN